MNFDQAFDALLEHEGGYSDHAADPGGKTRYGITEVVARSHGYRGDMRELPLDAALCRVALDGALDNVQTLDYQVQTLGDRLRDVQTLGDRLREVQTLGDRLRDVSSYLEEHPEVAASIKDEDFASIKDEELRSRLKQLFGQPALA